ncbi:hypothetical protein C8R45DRAFT_971894 [Mycena sanguinolenta]|nr:hypothetical protein C8R45DRAFT_971894 [Mycena sanguinolenta]
MLWITLARRTHLGYAAQSRVRLFNSRSQNPHVRPCYCSDAAAAPVLLPARVPRMDAPLSLPLRHRANIVRVKVSLISSLSLPRFPDFRFIFGLLSDSPLARAPSPDPPSPRVLITCATSLHDRAEVDIDAAPVPLDANPRLVVRGWECARYIYHIGLLPLPFVVPFAFTWLIASVSYAHPSSTTYHRTTRSNHVVALSSPHRNSASHGSPSRLQFQAIHGIHPDRLCSRPLCLTLEEKSGLHRKGPTRVHLHCVLYTRRKGEFNAPRDNTVTFTAMVWIPRPFSHPSCSLLILLFALLFLCGTCEYSTHHTAIRFESPSQISHLQLPRNPPDTCTPTYRGERFWARSARCASTIHKNISSMTCGN